MGMEVLVFRPTEYFRTFARRPSRRTIALGSFLLIAVVEAREAVPGPERGPLASVILGVGLNWLLAVFLLGSREVHIRLGFYIVELGRKGLGLERWRECAERRRCNRRTDRRQQNSDGAFLVR
ncbi:MAG: hypothetical protein BMS9Abin37_1476 [Acidobacteriota bacterium]|nr:MAG: hypothetical protein BMS9Abin37_1476 [Acidobacteriota bacterium]